MPAGRAAWDTHHSESAWCSHADSTEKEIFQLFIRRLILFKKRKDNCRYKSDSIRNDRFRERTWINNEKHSVSTVRNINDFHPFFPLTAPYLLVKQCAPWLANDTCKVNLHERQSQTLSVPYCLSCRHHTGCNVTSPFCLGNFYFTYCMTRTLAEGI